MADGILYSRPLNPRAQIVRVAAEASGVKLEEKHCDPSKDEFPDGYLGKFPMGKIPAYEGSSVSLSEVMAITQYIIRKSGDPAHLYGATEEDAAEATKWFSFANTELLPSIASWFAPLTGKVPYNKAAVAKGEEATDRVAKVLNDALKSRTFLVGERVTVADIAVAAMVVRGAGFVLDKAWRAKFPHLTRHVVTVINQPHFKKAFPEGQSSFVETRIAYTPPKKEEKPKAEKAPKEEKPKAEKKKAAKDDDDDDYDPTPAEPKAKHPCEALPAPGSFPLDEWKRQYSNAKETKDAMAWLDGKYDPKDYTLWKATYKYPEDLTMVFMSANLIGGFHNRLEASRKYLFGSAGVYGSNNNSKIQGVYMLRGNDYKPIFEVAPDFESYEFTQLDFSKPEDRAFVEGSWAWTDTVDGLEYADGKVFK